MLVLSSVVWIGLDLMIFQVAGPKALYCYTQLISRKGDSLPMEPRGWRCGHPVLLEFKPTQRKGLWKKQTELTGGIGHNLGRGVVLIPG